MGKQVDYFPTAADGVLADLDELDVGSTPAVSCDAGLPEQASAVAFEEVEVIIVVAEPLRSPAVATAAPLDVVAAVEKEPADSLQIVAGQVACEAAAQKVM